MNKYVLLVVLVALVTLLSSAEAKPNKNKDKSDKDKSASESTESPDSESSESSESVTSAPDDDTMMVKRAAQISGRKGKSDGKPGKGKDKDGDQSDESTESPESATSADSPESEESTDSPESEESTDSPESATSAPSADEPMDDVMDDGQTRGIDGKRRPGRQRGCRSGCSLVNADSGVEEDSRDCPDGRTCTGGPYNTTIDGQLFEVSYCRYEHDDVADDTTKHLGGLTGFGWDDWDKHFFTLAGASCSMTNGTISKDRDCCEGYSCASDEVEYDYAGSTWTFQFCLEDAPEGDVSQLQTMACRPRCRRPRRD